MADANHLKILSIGYYVYAGITALMSFIAVIYMVMGWALMSGKIPSGPSPSTTMPNENEMVGGLFLSLGSIFFVIIIAMAILCFLVARYISARKHPVFCMVIAAICCLNIPLGTIIGVFTFVVLGRPSVKSLFDAGPEANNFVH